MCATLPDPEVFTGPSDEDANIQDDNDGAPRPVQPCLYNAYAATHWVIQTM